MARLAEAPVAGERRPEREFAIEFEGGGARYARTVLPVSTGVAGGAFHPILKRCDKFLGSKLPKALETRRERANKLRLQRA